MSNRTAEELRSLGFAVDRSAEVIAEVERAATQSHAALVIAVAGRAQSDAVVAALKNMQDRMCTAHAFAAAPQDEWKCAVKATLDKLTPAERETAVKHLKSVTPFEMEIGAQTNFEVTFEVKRCTSQALLDNVVREAKALHAAQVQLISAQKYGLRLFLDKRFSREEAKEFIGPHGAYVKRLIYAIKEKRKEAAGVGKVKYIPHPTLLADVNKLDGSKILAITQSAADDMTDEELDEYADDMANYKQILSFYDDDYY
jgi:hypothetical protein